MAFSFVPLTVVTFINIPKKKPEIATSIFGLLPEFGSQLRGGFNFH